MPRLKKGDMNTGLKERGIMTELEEVGYEVCDILAQWPAISASTLLAGRSHDTQEGTRTRRFMFVHYSETYLDLHTYFDQGLPRGGDVVSLHHHTATNTCPVYI